MKRSIAKLSLGTVSKAMQRFSGEKLLCSYGVVLVAACIKGTESNWRAVFASGILQQVSAAVDRHSSDSQVSTLGPQLLALSKSQVRCAKGCVCVCVCECVCVCRCGHTLASCAFMLQSFAPSATPTTLLMTAPINAAWYLAEQVGSAK